MPILTNSDNLVRATPESWQQHLKSAIRSPEELAEELELPLNLICRLQAEGPFPLFVPRPFLGRIRKKSVDDPLLRQVLPVSEESEPVLGFVNDPLEESSFHNDAGMLQKYQGRALLIVNGTCAVHCRYCFRRHFPYSTNASLSSKWGAAIRSIGNDPSVREVILSGGDPLTLVDAKIRELVDQLSEIPHLQRIRIHTRLPILIPSRVTDELISILKSTRLDVVVVLHCNHAQEIDRQVVSACEDLKGACKALLNQAVLLRGINDDVDSLVQLSERLFAASVLPYYLHQLDRVQGAAHFEVSEVVGRKLIESVRAQLPGFLVPRYVREIAGEPNKTVIA